jgi:hypothetical protein
VGRHGVVVVVCYPYMNIYVNKNNKKKEKKTHLGPNARRLGPLPVTNPIRLVIVMPHRHRAP